jgi:hypothetical protein
MDCVFSLGCTSSNTNTHITQVNKFTIKVACHIHHYVVNVLFYGDQKSH